MSGSPEALALLESTVAWLKQPPDRPERRAAPAMPRDRFALSGPVETDEKAGFVAYGMSMKEPENASQGWKDGYKEHRENVLSVLTAYY